VEVTICNLLLAPVESKSINQGNFYKESTMNKWYLLPLLLLLVIGFILSGCGESTPTTTQPTATQPTATQPTSTQPTATQPTASTPTSTQPQAQKILKIGITSDLTGTLGNQVMNFQLLIAEMDNAKGGLKIGNDTYRVMVIPYSDDNDFNKGIAATNRLVYQDKVNYIVSHGAMTPDYVFPITDPNKVLDFSNAAIWNSGFLDKWKYGFSGLGKGAHEVAVAGWLLDENPEMKEPNNLAFALPDNAPGHQSASLISYPYKALGAQPSIVYYPADQRDLSSLGTKIRVMNPAWFMGPVSNVETIALTTAAVYDAGYRGKFFSFLTSDIGLLAPIFKPEVLEGFICAASAMEMNPQPTQLAINMKNAWIAKYGKWDYPDYMTTMIYFALTAAMQKAGSIDPDAVVNVLHQGLSGVDVPDGKLNMITRPDMRLDGYCVDAVTDSYLKQIKNKEVIILDHATPEDTLGYVRRAYPPLPPGATPTVFKPA